ncbi:MAG: VOC family protein [Roseiflexaceae bacterium]|nr:VOC family protein [Roseiflexaceae bacterium]
MNISGTHHIALLTSNFAQMLTFYTETLGLPVVGAFSGGTIVFLQVGGTTIELIERANYTAPQIGGWEHLAFTVADVDAAYDQLKALGVPFHVEPKDTAPPAEARIAFFKDPDGNILELFQPLGSFYPQNGMK